MRFTVSISRPVVPVAPVAPVQFGGSAQRKPTKKTATNKAEAVSTPPSIDPAILTEIKKREEQSERLKLLNENPNVDAKIAALTELLMDFVKANGRMIYGGMAIHQHLMEKTGRGIYVGNVYPDCEFYSPTPIEDCVVLCNRLADAKDAETGKHCFENIRAQEAHHRETYTIKVDGERCIDVSYVPLNILSGIPFRTYDGVKFVDIEFLYIDMYRVYNDLLFSANRLEKVYKREQLLMSTFGSAQSGQVVGQSGKIQLNPEHVSILKELFDKFVQPEGKIITGIDAYNMYLRKSEVRDAEEYVLPNDHFEVVSFDLKGDWQKITQVLAKYMKNVRKEEYVPFFQFTGHRLSVYHKDVPVIVLVDSHKRCIPFRTVDDIKVVSFDYLVMLLYIGIARARIPLFCGTDSQGKPCRKSADKAQESLYRSMLEVLRAARDHYLAENNLTGWEDDAGLFQEKVLTCEGQGEDASRAFSNFKTEQSRKFRGHTNVDFDGYVPFTYDPRMDRKKPEDVVHLNFSNTSGNMVVNPQAMQTGGCQQEHFHAEHASKLLQVGGCNDRMNRQARTAAPPRHIV